MNQGKPLVSERWIGLAVVLLLASAGCGSDGGDSHDSSGVQFVASPATVAPGQESELSWTGPKEATCHASGGWSGRKPKHGVFRTPPLQQTTSYSLSCSNAHGGSIAHVTVTVSGVGASSASDAPAVTLRAQQGSVPADGGTVLVWNAVADSCVASGGWSGQKPSQGTEQVSGLQADTTYTLTCEGANGTGIAMTEVMVQRATLRWAGGVGADAPASFRIFWGTQSGNPENVITISDPNARQRIVDLPGPGTYYFSLAALDAAAKEISHSNEASKVLPI
jgi:hypothetical protein